MDDTQTYTLTLAGKDYTFQAPSPELLKRLAMVLRMKASSLVLVEAAFKVLAEAAGEANWDDICSRYVEAQVIAEDAEPGEDDVTEAKVIGLLEDLVAASAKSAPADAE